MAIIYTYLYVYIIICVCIYNIYVCVYIYLVIKMGNKHVLLFEMSSPRKPILDLPISACVVTKNSNNLLLFLGVKRTK